MPANCIFINLKKQYNILKGAYFYEKCKLYGWITEKINVNFLGYLFWKVLKSAIVYLKSLLLYSELNEVCDSYVWILKWVNCHCN